MGLGGSPQKKSEKNITGWGLSTIPHTAFGNHKNMCTEQEIDFVFFKHKLLSAIQRFPNTTTSHVQRRFCRPNAFRSHGYFSIQRLASTPYAHSAERKCDCAFIISEISSVAEVAFTQLCTLLAKPTNRCPRALHRHKIIEHTPKYRFRSGEALFFRAEPHFPKKLADGMFSSGGGRTASKDGGTVVAQLQLRGIP